MPKGNEYAYLLEVTDSGALGEEAMRGALAASVRPSSVSVRLRCGDSRFVIQQLGPDERFGPRGWKAKQGAYLGIGDGCWYLQPRSGA